MSAGFRHFMNSLVDYAGLFPPASLDMPEAVANYAEYRQHAEAWMLGRFICPAGRLSEMVECLPQGYTNSGPWPCSVLVGNGQATDKALEVLPSQLENIVEVEQSHDHQVVAPAMEMPLPLDAVGQLEFILGEIKTSLTKWNLQDRELYLEVPAQGNPEDDARVLSAIQKSGYKAKFRCGGVTVEAFPSVTRLAGIIHAAAELNLPLKCTAGLHHPVRHLAEEPPTMMHGFLNVFGAGLLANARVGGLDLITQCLAETNPAQFQFSDQGFNWSGHQVARQDVEKFRNLLLPGFGSCSFDEPRQDLRDLGLLS